MCIVVSGGGSVCQGVVKDVPGSRRAFYTLFTETVAFLGRVA